MKKKNTLMTVLVTLAVVVTLAAAGLIAFIVYQNTHIFVENKAYPIKAQSLDLREDDISFAHYDSVHSQLPDCQIVWNVPFQGSKGSSDATRVTITNPSKDDIWILQTYFPNLKLIDASKCDNYTALEQLQEALPEVAVDYTISLGASVALPDAEELVLDPGTFDLDTLKEGLLFLHQVRSVTLRKMTLPLEEFQAMAESFPDIAFHYTVEILGQELDSGTDTLDLSGMESADLEAVCGSLPLLPELQTVELCGADGSSQLSKEEAKALIAAAPEAVFHYAFDFYGQTLSTDMEEVILKKVKIGDDGEGELRMALDLLSNCQRFVLEDCGLSNELLAKLREDYRGRTKVVWRVYFGSNGTCLTDAEVIRSVYDLRDKNSQDLVYCEDAKYADFGHDELLFDSSFLSGMTGLEVLILSGSPIKDLTPLENCKNLRVLEISNCGYITDLSPLAGCENLQMLNISHTKATDGLSALEGLNLTHLVAVGGIWNKIPQEDRDSFQEQHPDCWLTTSGNEYGVGWRYSDKETKMDWYKDAAEAFGYPNPYNNFGWYLKKE